MQAKFVTENIHFERGQEPKKSMQIGMLNEIKDYLTSNAYTYQNINQALRLCTFLDEKKYVKFLLEIGADLNAHHSRPPLLIAVKHQNIPLINFFIEKGADIHFKNEAPLALSILYNFSQGVEILIKAGADVNANLDPIFLSEFKPYKEIGTNTPLEHATYYNHYDMVKMLIQHGAKNGLDNALKIASDLQLSDIHKLLYINKI